MNLVKEIIQQHINELDHEPQEEFDGDVFYAVYPSIDWQAVEEDVFGKLAEHIDEEFVDQHFDIAQAEIQSLRDSQWFEDAIEQARKDAAEEHQRRTDPHGYYGVSKHEFI